MTVGQLEQRLKHYPRETTVLILVTTPEGQAGVKIESDLMPTFIRPDVDSVASSVMLVPEQELVKA